MVKLNAKQLRSTSPSEKEIAAIKRNPIYIILDDVLDTYNVGSIFRLADSVAVEKVYLCGETLMPPNSRIKKASINTWQWVPWEYAETAVSAIENLKFKIVHSTSLRTILSVNRRIENSLKIKNSKLKIICVEQHPKAISYTKLKVKFPLVLVVGNETYGVSKEVLKMADQIVEIPMWGVNKSLNVVVSLSIVLYKIMERMKE